MANKKNNGTVGLGKNNSLPPLFRRGDNLNLNLLNDGHLDKLPHIFSDADNRPTEQQDHTSEYEHPVHAAE